MTLLPKKAGASFKPEHFDAIADDAIGFFEVHAENYMGAGGPPHARLAKLRENYALSIHGVGLSIGGEEPLDREHLARLAALCARYEPESFSEHLAWSSHAREFLNDLLPLPYTRETLARVAGHIDQTQTTLGRTLLLENPSTYVQFAQSEFSEPDFLREIARRTGCGLLLDINNVFVSAANHGFDAGDYLSQFPLGAVGEIHLAGHKCIEDEDGVLLIDAHGSAVCDAVWALYADVLAKTGALPTLIEWDNDIPDWPVLHAEALKAAAILERKKAA